MQALVALAAVAVVGVLLVHGGSPYVVRLDMPSAGGLRQGADVKVGGATVGTVAQLDLGPRDVVQAKLELDSGRIGPGAAAAVQSANLLGDKYLALTPGDVGHPAASGTVIPAARVSFPVELDQVLDVLDPQTRARLTVLLDQAGRAVVGRRTDIGRSLEVFGPGLGRVQRLVDDLRADNVALRRTIDSADAWAAQFNAERAPLGRVVQTAAGTMDTVAAEHDALRATLARAPGTLRAARGFLGDLQRTTVPLAPAARAISATAPALSDTVAALPAFQRAARLALAAATRVAPELTTLADGATPVLRRAVPAVGAVRQLATDLPPLTQSLGKGIDGILSLLQGWARAVQTRDGAGHVFRGDFIFGPALLQHALAELDTPARSARPTPSKHAEQQPTPVTATPAPAVATSSPAPDPCKNGPRPLSCAPLLDQVQSGVTNLTTQTQSLLDFLLKP